MAINKYLFWGVLLGIIVWLTASRLLKENAPAQGGGNRGGGGSAPMMIKAKIIKPQTLANKIQSTGSVIANEEVELRSEVSGRVVRVYFREGSVISKNDLLIKINDAELTAQLERAESKRKLAESNEVRQRG
ncbi:MAG TPA: biotin/lipoyl-binding protein, partial [bacterium]|nr:biotin/lipoyl-binding protein [bacterium]